MTEKPERLGPPDKAAALVALASNLRPSVGEWYREMEKAETSTLVAALGGLGREDLVAFREAVRGMIDLRLTDRMIEKMDALERASNRLAIVGICVGAVLGVAGLVLAGVQVWVALGR